MENKLRIPLRFKAVIQNIVIVGFFSIILAWSVYRLISISLIDIKKQETANIIETQQRELVVRLSDKQNEADFLAKNETISAYLLTEIKKRKDKPVIDIFKIISSEEGVDNVYLIDQNGQVILSIDPTFLNNNFGFRNYFTKAIKGESATEFALGTVTKLPGFYISTPVINNGVVLGVVVIKANAEYVLSSFNDTGIKDYGYYFLTDKNGVIIHTNKDVPKFSSLGVLSAEERRSLDLDRTYTDIEIKPLQYGNVMEMIRNYQGAKKEVKFIDDEDDDEEMLELSKVGKFDYFVVLESSLRTVYMQDRQIMQPVLIIMSVVVLLGVLVQYYVFQRLFAPLSKLDKYSNNVANNLATGPIEINTGDEIENLAKSMSSMVSLLKADNRSLSSIVSEKNTDLAKNLKELEQRNREMDETETAMINLLEDAHNLEKQLAEEKVGVEKKVTERTKQLVETTTQFQHAIDSVPRVFVVLDVNSKIVFRNNKLESILGVNTADWTVDKIDNILGDSVQIKQKINDVLKKSEVVNYRDVAYGNKVLSIYISPIDSSDKKENIGAVMTIEDVTEKVLMERSKDEFFSIASHELRTPLTAIRGNTSMIQEYYKEQIKDPELSSMIADIHDSSVRLIDIVNDFLNISRLEQGKMEFKKEEVDLVEVIPEIIKEYVDAKLTNKIDIIFTPPKAKELKVLADSGKVKQVLVNLIGNSLKFTTKGNIAIYLEELPKMVKVLVTDTGRGIPEKQQGLLFRKFQQAGESLFTRDTVGGTGLGLYISKKMVEGMNGEIKMESSVEGKGTTFSFSLPSIDKNKI